MTIPNFSTLLIAFLCLLATNAQAQNTAVESTKRLNTANLSAEQIELILGDRRWSENSYGISFRIPDGMISVAPKDPGSIARFIANDRTLEIDITLAELDRREALPDWRSLRTRATQQFLFAQPSAVILAEANSRTRPGGRPADRLYFHITDRTNGDWFHGQTFILINREVLLTVKMSCAESAFDIARLPYEAMITSLQVMSPEQLRAMREAMLEAGERWLERLDLNRLSDLLGEEFWFRIQSFKEDIGYERVTFADVVRNLNDTGLEVTRQRRINQDARRIDLAASYFQHTADNSEEWTIRSTERPRNASMNQPDLIMQSGVITGLRDGASLQVVTETKSSVDPQVWAIPTRGYLSQSMWLMLPHLLPLESKEMAFYVYDADIDDMSLHTVIINPDPTGDFIATIKKRVTAPPYYIRYSKEGQLKSIQYPTGITILPTNQTILTKLWRELR